MPAVACNASAKMRTRTSSVIILIQTKIQLTNRASIKARMGVTTMSSMVDIILMRTKRKLIMMVDMLRLMVTCSITMGTIPVFVVPSHRSGSR